MATRIKSSQILDGAIVAADLHSAITINTTSTINSSNITSTGYIEAAGNISTGADAGRLRAGASNEMQLYFSGSHGFLTSSTGNFTIDSAGDIFLNADGADIVLADDTVDFGRFKRDAGDFVIKAETVDKDIILRGTKAGSPNVTIDALLLDMSNDGRATFNENVIINGNLQVDGTQTILNTTTLDVEDVNITVASEATNSQEADGAGITIEGAGAIFAWDHAQGSMTLNKELRLDNNKGLFFSNAAANATVGLKADTSDNITFRQNGQWDRLVIKNSGVDISGNIYTGNNLSVGTTSALKGYFYESTSDQNGNTKPSSVLGVASSVNSRGEGPSIDFNAVWQGGGVYQQETWDDGWTVGRIAGVYDVSGLDTGALAFYTQTSGSGDGANASGLTEKLRISSSGNVGIGVTDPGTRKLKIHGTSGDVSGEISTDDTSNAFLRFSTDLDGTHRSGIIGVDYSDNVFKLNHGGSFDGVLNGLAINSSGNVGIGTASPNATLALSDGTDVFDFGVTENLLMIKSVTADGSDDQRIILDAGNGGQTSTRGAFVALSGNEASTNPGQAIYQMGNVTGSSHVFRKAGGIDAVIIDEDGKVGIANDNPLQILSVGGRMNVDQQNDYYGAWADGNTSGDSWFAVGTWHNNGGRMSAGSSIGDGLHLYTHNTSHHLTLQKDGGNVGIGTDAVVAKLHVHDDTATTDSATLVNKTSTAFGWEEEWWFNARNTGSTAGTAYVTFQFANPSTTNVHNMHVEYTFNFYREHPTIGATEGDAVKGTGSYHKNSSGGDTARSGEVEIIGVGMVENAYIETTGSSAFRLVIEYGATSSVKNISGKITLINNPATGSSPAVTVTV